MAFRISDSTIYDSAVRNTRLNRFNLHTLQAQLTSGKRLLSLSDDPSDAARVLDLRRAEAQLTQFQRNAEAAQARLEPAESALSALTDLLSRVRELAVGADLQPEEFDAARDEVEQRFEELVSIANSRSSAGFLFGGFASATEPFTVAGAFVDGVVDPLAPAVAYGGDANVLSIQLTESSTVPVTATGAEIFLGDADGDAVTDANRVDLFALFRDLRNRLEDPTTVSDPTYGTGTGATEVIDDLDRALDQVLQVRARLGASANRIESTQDQLASLATTLTGERSNLEDVDYVAGAIELTRRETVYQASLAATARILPLSLLDFLG